MKTGFLALIVMVMFAAAAALHAQQITANEVRACAGTFACVRYPAAAPGNARTITAAGQSALAVADVTALTTNGMTVGHIVTLAPDGFMLFRADDHCPPLKLHSEQGSFEQLPPAFKEIIVWELAQEAAYVAQQQARKSRVFERRTAANVALWAALKNADANAPSLVNIRTSAQVGPLLSTRWNQDAPYNMFAPHANGGPGGRAWGGCVATAMAQIMKYHNAPGAPRSDASYVDSQGACRGAHAVHDAGMGDYDWVNMPDGPSLGGQAAPVARLIYHAGVGARMNFESSGSGAYSDQAAEALRTRFNYSPRVLYNNRTIWLSKRFLFFFRYWWPVLDGAWVARVSDDIHERLPMYYSMQGASAGHAVVCEGFRGAGGWQGSGEIYLNFGWSGAANAWYDINSSFYGSIWNHGAIFGITPAEASYRVLAINSTHSGVRVERRPSVNAWWSDEQFVTPARTVRPWRSMTFVNVPRFSAGKGFSRWLLDGVAQPLGQRTLSVSMSDAHAVNAEYVSLTPPPNDLFAAARVIAGTSGNIAGSNIGARAEAGEPSHDPGRRSGPFHSVWYKWTEPLSAGGNLTFTAQPLEQDSDLSPQLAVYRGTSLGGMVRLAASGYSVSLEIAPTSTYYLALDGARQDGMGGFNLAWRFKPHAITVYADAPPAGSGVPIALSQPDIYGDRDGTTTLSRVYTYGTTVTLTAPAKAGRNNFNCWLVNGSVRTNARALTLTAIGSINVRAVFGASLLMEWETSLGYFCDFALDPAGVIYMASGADVVSRPFTLYRYTPQGQFIGRNEITAPYGYFSGKIALDAGGNLFALVEPEARLRRIRLVGTNYQDIWSQPCTGSVFTVDAQGNSYVYQSRWDIPTMFTKFNADGMLQWSRLWNGSRVTAITASRDGYIYVGGTTYGSYDGQPYTTNGDFYITKFDSSGYQYWTRIWGSALPGNDNLAGICVDKDGNVWVAGDTDGSIDGQTPQGVCDMCLFKFSPSGDRIFTRMWGSATDTDWRDSCSSVCADPLGNIYVSGITHGGFDGESFPPDTTVGFLSKFNSAGERQLSRFQQGDYWNKGNLACDRAGNVYRRSDYTVFKYAPLADSSSDGVADAPLLAGERGGETANTTDATTEPGEQAHAGGSGPFHSVWWKVAPQDYGELSLATYGSGFDTVLAVYTNAAADGTRRRRAESVATASQLVPIAANDNADTNTTASAVRFAATPGVTYFVAVDGRMQSETGTINMVWEVLPNTLTVRSENPGSAVPITVSPRAVSGETNGLTPFTCQYYGSAQATLTAPASVGASPFNGWVLDGGVSAAGLTIEVSMHQSRTAKAVYGTPTNFGLLVRSLNPSTDVAIELTPADVNGASNGVTQLIREYESNTLVTLTAPVVALGTQFDHWELDGATAGTARTLLVRMSSDAIADAIYRADTTRSYTLQVQSANPAAGVTIGVQPADTLGNAGGGAPFSRTYFHGQSVDLSAPADALGNTFAWWELGDGTRRSESVLRLTMTNSQTVCVVYQVQSNKTLRVSSENPGASVLVTVSAADTNGNASGIAPFTRVYTISDNVTLTVPDTQAGEPFTQWLIDGTAAYYGTTLTLAMTAPHTAKAMYGRFLEPSMVRIWGSATNEGGACIRRDAAGNLYIAGTTDGAFDQQPGIGEGDLFLTKYSAVGELLWTRIAGTVSNDVCTGLAVDDAGNACIVGATMGAFDGQINNGLEDMCILKFTPSGTRAWTRMIGSSEADDATGVSMDPAGNIYVSGVSDGDLGGQTNAGLADACLLKLSPAGSTLWVRVFGSDNEDAAADVCVAPNSQVIVVGFTATNLFGQPYAGEFDAMLTAFSADGARLWTRAWGSAANDMALSVCADGNGNIYAAGTTSGTLDGQSNSSAIATAFLTRFTAGGTRAWSRVWNAPQGAAAYAVAADDSGNAYIAGEASDSLDDEPLVAGGDLCLVKYTPDGVRQMTRMAGSTDADAAFDLCLDNAGNVFVAGYTDGEFGGQTNAGMGSACLVKFSEAVPEPAVALLALLPLWLLWRRKNATNQMQDV